MLLRVLGVLSIFILVVSCNVKTKTTGGNQRLTDTLYYETVNINDSNDSCLTVINSFHKKFNIYISDFFVILDSLTIDLNNDQVMDRIIVVSPLFLEAYGAEKCQFGKDRLSKRLLVEVLNLNGQGKIRHVYTNLISDVGGVLSPYNGIFSTEDGFKIIHEAGAKYSWHYSNKYSVKKGLITLVETYKRCSYDNKEKDVSYRFNNIPASEVNIQDTLARQCNCDEYWGELEKSGTQ
jgi:hypothetical protein